MKKDINELTKEIVRAKKDYVGRKFLHHSGSVYYVETLSINESDNAIWVNYAPIHGGLIGVGTFNFCRPLSEFEQKFKRIQPITLLVTEEEFKELADRFGSRGSAGN